MGDLSGAADVSSPLAARAASIDPGEVSNMTGRDPSRRFAPAARDIGDALGFFTRMPVGASAGAPLDLNRFAWAAPVAGAAVGLVGALALALTGLSACRISFAPAWRRPRSSPRPAPCTRMGSPTSPTVLAAARRGR